MAARPASSSRSVTETYTQSPYRPDAKLGVGDTYLGEGTPEALVLALNEFQEFLAFYPTHPRADYAQYKVGMTHHRQMRSAGRDQTETRAAVTVVRGVPDPLSEQHAAVRRARRGCARRAIGSANTSSGSAATTTRSGGIRRRSSAGRRSSSRIPRTRDATSVYFFLGESLIKMGNAPEALPYFERLVTEFEQSEHLAGSPRSNRAAEDHRRRQHREAVVLGSTPSVLEGRAHEDTFRRGARRGCGRSARSTPPIASPARKPPPRVRPFPPRRFAKPRCGLSARRTSSCASCTRLARSFDRAIYARLRGPRAVVALTTAAAT